MKISSSLAIAAVMALALPLRAEWVEAHPSPVKITELPAVAQEALLKAAPGSGIEAIVKWPGFYMIDLTLNGLQKTVRVNEEGTKCDEPRQFNRRARVNQGTVINWSDLPLAVRDLMGTKFQGAPLGEVRRGVAVYRATLLTPTGKVFLFVTEDGTILPAGREAKGPGAGGGAPTPGAGK